MTTAIRSLNQAHYSSETKFYTNADLRPVEQRLIALLPPARRILDVGCGPARVSSRLALAGHSATGIDLVPECIAAARATFPNLTLDLQVADMCAMPFDDHSFDEVWCLRFSFNALGSETERITALKEMRRVCKPGGRMLVESFNYLFAGRFGLMWLANGFDEMSRTLRTLAGSPSPRLPRGDLLYLASKSERAAPGYTHIPTQWELARLCSRAELADFEIISPKSLFRRRGGANLTIHTSYSIWVRWQHV
jgi:SAM-dependent methyltransferase